MALAVSVTESPATLADAVTVGAVVSRGGRPDLASEHLSLVRAPTLLIVGGEDTAVIELNRRAFHLLSAAAEITIVPGATHLFEEEGALEKVAELAGHWFVEHLPQPPRYAEPRVS